MAFRALLFSKSPKTDAAITAACNRAKVRAEVCSDIFAAIEKVKTQVFSCVIVDWAEQPEASFLLKRARESAPNRNTVAIAIVDYDPTPADLRENRLDFLIHRPISAEEAYAVLGKACERMTPLSASDAAKLSREDDAASAGPSADFAAGDATERVCAGTRRAGLVRRFSGNECGGWQRRRPKPKGRRTSKAPLCRGISRRLRRPAADDGDVLLVASARRYGVSGADAGGKGPCFAGSGGGVCE